MFFKFLVFISYVIHLGLAATNVCGVTYHSAMKLRTKGRRRHGDALFGTTPSSEAIGKWREVILVLLDEVSMLSASGLSIINTRMKQLKCSSDDFGGVHFIVLGDFAQLPPVGMI
jgi:hypothetical protein